MDRLAACHALYGFMQLPGSRRGRHSSAPSCQNVKRSLSLADRRGLISPGPHSFSRLHDIGLLMHALGGPGQVFLSAAAMDLNRGGAEVSTRNLTYGRKSTEVIERLNLWRGEQLGQLLISLRYSPGDGQLNIGVVRASGVRVPAPYIVAWLLREAQKPEKRSGPRRPKDGRRFSIAPVFDEIFEFEIASSEIQDATIVISVMNTGTGGIPDVEIGYCVLGELAIEEAGREHWRQATGQPGNVVTRWATLFSS
uniref:C2 domain-containing protein n=1 Tax=Meloidogyne hapla TaxID=6305 RepID=A0A1I8B2F4_MELHA